MAVFSIEKFVCLFVCLFLLLLIMANFSAKEKSSFYATLFLPFVENTNLLTNIPRNGPLETSMFPLQLLSF